MQPPIQAHHPSVCVVSGPQQPIVVYVCMYASETTPVCLFASHTPGATVAPYILFFSGRCIVDLLPLPACIVNPYPKPKRLPIQLSDAQGYQSKPVGHHIQSPARKGQCVTRTQNIIIIFVILYRRAAPADPSIRGEKSCVNRVVIKRLLSVSLSHWLVLRVLQHQSRSRGYHYHFRDSAALVAWKIERSQEHLHLECLSLCRGRCCCRCPIFRGAGFP